MRILIANLSISDSSSQIFRETHKKGGASEVVFSCSGNRSIKHIGLYMNQTLRIRTITLDAINFIGHIAAIFKKI